MAIDVPNVPNLCSHRITSLLTWEMDYVLVTPKNLLNLSSKTRCLAKSSIVMSSMTVAAGTVVYEHMMLYTTVGRMACGILQSQSSLSGDQ